MTQEEIEFVGFFMGEGSLCVRRCIDRNSLGDRTLYMPQICIDLRIDDLPLLFWIQKHIGGHVYYKQKNQEAKKFTDHLIGRTYTRNPTARWCVTSVKEARCVISLLEQVKMPAYKAKQIAIFKRFLDLKKRGHRRGLGGHLSWYTTEELNEIEKVKQELSSAKIFRVI